MAPSAKGKGSRKVIQMGPSSFLLISPVTQRQHCPWYSIFYLEISSSHFFPVSRPEGWGTQVPVCMKAHWLGISVQTW